MPLTRHLYELDEVISSLQLSLRNKYPRSCFWLWELVMSEEPQIAYATLLEVWATHGGGWFAPTVLSIKAPTTEAEWLYILTLVEDAIARTAFTAADLLARTCAMARPSTGFALKKKGVLSSSTSVTVARYLESLDPLETVDRTLVADWFILLEIAVHKRHVIAATWLLHGLSPILSADAIWSALSIICCDPSVEPVIRLIREATTTHPTAQLIAQINAVLLLCAETRDAMLVDHPIKTSGTHNRLWAEYNSKLGRRTARMADISAEALHTGTIRGQLSIRYSNIDEIREPWPLLHAGCRFWRRILQESSAWADPVTGRLEFPDDKSQELFDLLFPDDIPDEWSLTDQSKSHGRGCAETAPPPPYINCRYEPISHEDMMQWCL